MTGAMGDAKACASPRFSIVTITRNNLAGFARTAQSVVQQRFADREWIVIDDASTDGTAAFAKSLAPPPTVLVCEADEGIFDAMAKGLALARGEFVIFMNAGDCFFDDETLRKAHDALADAPVVLAYGDTIEADASGSHYKAARNPAANRYAMFTHHQSQFYRTSVARMVGFDHSYVLSADWVLTTRVLRQGCVLRLPFAVSRFERGGLSQQARTRKIFNAELFRIYRQEHGLSRITAALFWAVKVSVNKVRSWSPGLYDWMRYR